MLGAMCCRCDIEGIIHMYAQESHCAGSAFLHPKPRVRQVMAALRSGAMPMGCVCLLKGRGKL